MTSPATLEQQPTGAMPLARNPWVFDPLLGIALGLPILGVGSRIAMRTIAHATSVAPGFSFGGTMTVVFLGTVIFGIILTLLTLRGASPFTPLSLFLPLTLVYGAILHLVHRRRFT